MSVIDFKGIAKAGGSIILNAQYFSALDLKSIAADGKEFGADIIIKGASKFSALDCRSIAGANPGHVTFDFT